MIFEVNETMIFEVDKTIMFEVEKTMMFEVPVGRNWILAKSGSGPNLNCLKIVDFQCF